MSKKYPLPVGSTWGNWTILSEEIVYVLKDQKKEQPRQLCRCSCGLKRLVFIYHLPSGVSKGCGNGHRHMVNFEGKTLPLATACKEAKISPQRPYYYIREKEFSPQLAFDTSLQRRALLGK